MTSGKLKFPLPLAIVTGLVSTVFVGLGLVELSHAQGAPTASGGELHGKQLAQAYCAGCHGADGNSADQNTPKLAGQDASYLLAQMRDFKTGARKSDVMSGPASALTDSQIEELANFYSRETAKPDAVKDATLANIGARIFTSPMSGAPPCAACHGQGGYGSMGSMMNGQSGMGPMGGGMMESGGRAPILNGQHAAYTLQRLDAFASGTQNGTVMEQIAAGLSEKDRKAVAEYISGLR